MVKSNPGITMLEIAEQLNINYRTVTRHLKTLVTDSRVSFKLMSRKRHYFDVNNQVFDYPHG